MAFSLGFAPQAFTVVSHFAEFGRKICCTLPQTVIQDAPQTTTRLRQTLKGCLSDSNERDRLAK